MNNDSNSHLNYYSQLVGAKILAYEGILDSDEYCEGFPTLMARLADGTLWKIQVSRDEEGNGGGFLFQGEHEGIIRKYRKEVRGSDHKDGGPLAGAFIYGWRQDLENVLHIDEAHHIMDLGKDSKEGRYYLMIERSEWMSDDLGMLEAQLGMWMLGEYEAPTYSMSVRDFGEDFAAGWNLGYTCINRETGNPIWPTDEGVELFATKAEAEATHRGRLKSGQRVRRGMYVYRPVAVCNETLNVMEGNCWRERSDYA